jgi:hypothetical protein
MKGYTEGVMEGFRIAERVPKERHKPKRERALQILRQCFPPDGEPPPELRLAAIKKAYRDACDGAGIPRDGRYSESQLWRIVGRKKP